MNRQRAKKAYATDPEMFVFLVESGSVRTSVLPDTEIFLNSNKLNQHSEDCFVSGAKNIFDLKDTDLL